MTWQPIDEKTPMHKEVLVAWSDVSESGEERWMRHTGIQVPSSGRWSTAKTEWMIADVQFPRRLPDFLIKAWQPLPAPPGEE